MFDNNAERQLGAYNFGLGQVCRFIMVCSQCPKPECDSETRKIKARLHYASMIDLECQRQRLPHIWSIGVAVHFWSGSLGLLRTLNQFNQGDIASDIPLTLTLSVNKPLNDSVKLFGSV